ncbi:helix-turn-helix domain-containing protein [Chitinophaga nivalis]|uniref:AraC family transcriptional regulator n=1 Tax=Chitinophaga nivalis TaxID=2991709 RepID=A0ABT3IGG8_9BACT|nr:AraC family transcriptional regulator [Chitinophaga nivalis]MCW3467275.1 AraC family transcriptional regulator [Chitinophaga nivalis]MCW3483033.1 AraC family transcriptional regulator [Chitinophaga nivalis]
MKSSVRLFTNYEYKKLFLPGLSRQILQNDSKLQLYRIEDYLRNIVIPVLPYRTSFNFLIFVTQGTIVQQLEAAAHSITANSLLLIKQGSITATLEISADATGYFMVYENEIINNLSLKTNIRHFFFSSPFAVLPAVTVKWLDSLLQLIETELSLANGSIDIAISLFQSLLSKIIRQERTGEQALTRSLEIAFHFRELVQQHHLTQKSVLFYAHQLNISENYLNKCVKEATGKPPKQWINEIAILHSQILLQDLTRDIAGIAFEMNFQSASYFTRLFRKITGVSPSDYRKKITHS